MNLFELVFKNSFRKKTRFTLTCLSVVVAFFLLTTLAGIDHALKASVSNSNQYRLMTSHKISIAQSLPINYQQKIKALSGVEDATYISWFGGYFQNEKNQLAVMAVDHNSYFDIFDEYQIPAEQLVSWKNTRTGLVISQDIAKQYAWEVGDKVPLSSSIWMNKEGAFNWEFTVSAIYQKQNNAVDSKRIFFQHLYFDKARAYAGNTASWFSTQIKTDADSTEVSKALDTLFTNSDAATRTTTEQVFIREQAQQFVDMAMVIKIVLIAVFFTLLLIVCNTMIQVNRERLNETAMMKAIGFSSGSLVKQVYLESLLMMALGATLGSLLATMTLSQVQQQFADFLPGIAIDPSHYVTVLILVITAAGLCTIFPAITIKKLIISESLGARA
ncbi:MAG: putative ABC transport system permease protein [Alteromonadaceae bacterium]|jgi:putative ABC transport system permease protein